MAVPTQVCTVQDQIIDTIKSLNERAPFALPFAVPFADRIPAPGPAVERAFGLAADLLDNQKQFTIRLLEAVIPHADGAGA